VKTAFLFKHTKIILKQDFKISIQLEKNATDLISHLVI